MKKFVNLIVFIFVFFFVSIPVLTAQRKPELKKISLTYSDHSPPDTRGALFLKQEYFPRIQKEIKKIGYELDVTYHHNESLYKSTDQAQACEAGLIDITIFSINYEPDKAPLHEVLTLPFMEYNEYSATRVWRELQNTIPEFGAEFSGFKELAHFMALPNVFNLKKVARVPEDYKGLKIACVGMMADMFQSVGAIPVMQSPIEWKASMEQDLIDCIVVGITGVPMYNLQDTVKVHVQPTGDSMGYIGTSFVMNREKYESLPPEVRKSIDNNVEWASNRLVEIEAKNTPIQAEICRKAGNTFINLTSKEMEQWRNVFNPLHEKWIKDMEAKGLPGEKVYNEAKRLAKKFKN